MNRSQRQTTEFGIWLDIRFIIRTLRKWLIVSVCAAIVAAVITYIGLDSTAQDSFSTNAVISVVARQNSSSYLADRSLSSAMARNVDMWNSNVLMQTIKATNPNREIQGTLKATSISGTGLISLTAVAKTAEDAYVLLTQAIDCSSQIDGSFDRTYYNVVLSRINSSSISRYHSSPRKYTAMAFLLVLVGCLGLVFVWTVITDIIHSEDQAKELLEISLYESLPNVKMKKTQMNLSFVLSNKNLDMDYMEAFDRLTTHVENHLRICNQKTLMITSVSANEGKTTVAVNLALNLARRGKKVLLADLDLRNPSVNEQLKLDDDKTHNISKAFKGEVSFAEQIESYKDSNKLDLLKQVGGVNGAEELLENESMNRNMESVFEAYDYVIFDTPPAGPVRDAAVIANFAEACLLVVCQDRTRGTIINDVCDELEENGTICIGAVLNRSSAKKVSEKKYGHNGYRYSYRKEDHR